MSKVLCIMDMQNDFITGALRNEEGIKIIPTVQAIAEKALHDNDTSIFMTKDTHKDKDYKNTQEGKLLPIPHCLLGTEGQKIIPELQDIAKHTVVIQRTTFGTTELARFIRVKHRVTDVDEIALIGVCTDTCVISNALLLKTAFPETPIVIYENACAGTTPEKHEAALQIAMSCQIYVKTWTPDC